MKRKYVELWVAVDGTEFTTQEECDKYEKEKGFAQKYDVEIHRSSTYSTQVYATSKKEALQKAREEMQYDYVDWNEDEPYVELANDWCERISSP